MNKFYKLFIIWTYLNLKSDEVESKVSDLIHQLLLFINKVYIFTNYIDNYVNIIKMFTVSYYRNWIVYLSSIHQDGGQAMKNLIMIYVTWLIFSL